MTLPNSLTLSRIFIVPLLVVVLAWTFPILWTLITSLKPAGAGGPLSASFAFQPTLDNYATLFSERGFGASLLNSLVLAGSATVVSPARRTSRSYVPPGNAR